MTQNLKIVSNLFLPLLLVDDLPQRHRSGFPGSTEERTTARDLRRIFRGNSSRFEGAVHCEHGQNLVLNTVESVNIAHTPDNTTH